MAQSFFYPLADATVVDVGDPIGGGVSDAVGLQAKLTALGASGGGVLRLRRGTYYVATALGIPSNVTVQGAGIGATVLRAKAGTMGFYTSPGGQVWYGPLTAAGVSHVTIRDLTIDLATNGCDSNGLEIGYDGNGVASSFVMVDGVEVLGKAATHQYCIWSRRATDVKIVNCWVDGNDATPGPTGVDHAGIEVFGGSRVLVQGNHCKNLDGPALTIFTNSADSTTDGVVFTGNVIDNVGEGMLFSASYVGGVSQSVLNLTISDNVMSNCAVAGIKSVAAASSITEGINIMGNTISDAVDPIRLGGLTGSIWRTVSVSGNVCNRSTGTVGMFHADKVNGVTVTGNTFRTTAAGPGIRVDTLTDSIIANNSIEGAYTYAIHIGTSSARLLVTGNYVADWDLATGLLNGILASGNDLAIVENRFYRSDANHPRVINVTAGDKCDVSRNRLMYTTTNTVPFANASTNPTRAWVTSIAAGLTTLQVTNTQVNASSQIRLFQSAGTFKIGHIAVAQGSFTINFTDTTAGNEQVRYEVVQ